MFFRRAVSCLFDVAETDRFSLRAGRGRIPVPEIFTQEFEAHATSLEDSGRSAGTLRAKTGLLRRFLAFLAEHGRREMATLSTRDVSAYVRSLAPMAASIRASHLYLLRQYLRFVVVSMTDRPNQKLTSWAAPHKPLEETRAATIHLPDQ